VAQLTPVPVYEADHEPKGICAEKSGEFFSMRALEHKPFLLVSAIVDNDSFRRIVEAAGAQVVDHIIRRDHHHWTRSEIKSLAKQWRGNIAGILTTEKDATKIDPDWVEEVNSDWRSPFPLASLRIGLRLGQTEETELQELILSKLKAA
jgi:tetraacyldisaccharide 4'-kinase